MNWTNEKTTSPRWRVRSEPSLVRTTSATPMQGVNIDTLTTFERYVLQNIQGQQPPRLHQTQMDPSAVTGKDNEHKHPAKPSLLATGTSKSAKLSLPAQKISLLPSTTANIQGSHGSALQRRRSISLTNIHTIKEHKPLVKHQTAVISKAHHQLDKPPTLIILPVTGTQTKAKEQSEKPSSTKEKVTKPTLKQPLSAATLTTKNPDKKVKPPSSSQSQPKPPAPGATLTPNYKPDNQDVGSDDSDLCSTYTKVCFGEMPKYTPTGIGKKVRSPFRKKKKKQKKTKTSPTSSTTEMKPVKDTTGRKGKTTNTALTITVSDTFSIQVPLPFNVPEDKTKQYRTSNNMSRDSSNSKVDKDRKKLESDHRLEKWRNTIESDQSRVGRDSSRPESDHRLEKRRNRIESDHSRLDKDHSRPKSDHKLDKRRNTIESDHSRLDKDHSRPKSDHKLDKRRNTIESDHSRVDIDCSRKTYVEETNDQQQEPDIELELEPSVTKSILKTTSNIKEKRKRRQSQKLLL